MDLSRPYGDSLNDCISSEEFSCNYCSVNGAVALLIKISKRARTSKLDIEYKHAYRLIAVRSQDYNLLSFFFNHQYFYDIVSTFGLCSSAFIFCWISEAVSLIISYISNHAGILVYVDEDFFVGSYISDNCARVTACTKISYPCLVFRWPMKKRR